MDYNISVDVGGTFTDLVVSYGNGKLGFYKASTTVDDISIGILDGISIIAADLGILPGDLLASCQSFSCGTTAATNAILEGKVARTALICTEGFRDILHIREGGREDTSDLYVDYPDPYIPRHLTFGVTERVNAEGGIETALQPNSIQAVIEAIRREKVEAVAVSLLWSFVNPQHELEIARALEAALPGVPYSLSHQVSPTLREYRRTSATAIDASLKPIVRQRIGTLAACLQQAGFAGELTFITSNGGRASAEEVIANPVYLCLSGPSAAPGAAYRLSRADGFPEGNVIAIDMGGTSFDVSVVVRGDSPMHREGMIAGHMFGVPSVDVKTIGAGGGSIARLDSGGMLHVGPESAGAFPGPACYGRGGINPTVTDANLVRGMLNPANFAAGRFQISTENARHALTAISEPLGMSVEQAADLICVAAEQSMIAAIEEITILKGIDPRDFVLVSGGAAGGLHAATIAREIGITKVLFPAAAGVLSAFGIATSDVKFSFTRNCYTTSDAFDYDRVNETLDILLSEGRNFLDRMMVPPERRELRFSARAHYAGQVWDLTLPLRQQTIADRSELERLVEDFHAVHEDNFLTRSPGDTIEFIQWDLQAVGLVSGRGLPVKELTSAPACQESMRRVFFGRPAKFVEIPIYDRTKLTPGMVVVGPALVEDPLSTSLVPENATARYSSNGALIVELDRTQLSNAA